MTVSNSPSQPKAPSSELRAQSSSCYLVTGAAGFIASRVCEMLLADGHTVVGVDNLNDYYDVRLKYYRLSRLAELAGCPADEVAKIKHHAAAAETPNAKGPKAKQWTGTEEGKGGEGIKARGGEEQIGEPSNPRLSIRSARFEFQTLDIENLPALDALFAAHKFDAVINLAARAGVRASIEQPELYRRTNIVGEENVLRCQVKYGVRKHVLASSSSVYAGCPMPFTEDSVLGTMQSPYAETKHRAEEIAREYHVKHGLDVTVLRYFTVFGPAGRPDMAPYRFVHWIATGQPITLYGDGNQSRDFTYVDDIARGTILAAKPLGGRWAEDGGRWAEDGGRREGLGALSPELKAPDPELLAHGSRLAAQGHPPGASRFEIINLGGGNQPITINAMIALLEGFLGKSAVIERHPVNPVDMTDTRADITRARELLGWIPQISVAQGFEATVDWYRDQQAWLGKISL